MNSEKKLSFVSPSWDYIENLSFQLYMKIKMSGFRPDIMAGVSRGGLVPARILSDLFLAEQQKVTLAIMQVGFYSGIDKTEKEPIIYQDLPGHIYGRKVLLVDDVADSGVSLDFALRYLQMKKPSEILVGTLYHKPWSSFKPNFFIENTSSWIVFPHERMEFMAEQFRGKNMSIDEARKYFISEVGLSKQCVDNFLKLKDV